MDINVIWQGTLTYDLVAMDSNGIQQTKSVIVSVTPYNDGQYFVGNWKGTWAWVYYGSCSTDCGYHTISNSMSVTISGTATVNVLAWNFQFLDRDGRIPTCTGGFSPTAADEPPNPSYPGQWRLLVGTPTSCTSTAAPSCSGGDLIITFDPSYTVAGAIQDNGSPYAGELAFGFNTIQACSNGGSPQNIYYGAWPPLVKQ
jgi:hypothetical protein